MASNITPQEFAQKWSNVQLKESAASQQHFIDLCRLVGHQTPAEMDRKGEFFTFEAGASKQTGGQGWADVWKKGHFGWEYKGRHADLDKAYQQLLQYRESLENPPLLVVSDMERILIHTNFTNTVKRTYTITLDDLLTTEGRDLLRAVFLEPDRLKAPETPEDVTKEAAMEFARLAEILAEWGEDPQRTAHFLIRILFCLFAEDIGLLPKDLFSRLLQQVGRRTNALERQLRRLFGEMVEGGWFGADRIAQFDGGLFDDDFTLKLSSDAIDILHEVSRLDWSSIEPSIFGTLFERSLDPRKRSALGLHYTSKDDILLIVEPVLMAPLRRRWEEVRKEAEALAAQGSDDQEHEAVRELLLGFRKELASIDVLDAASGSGNFLYVSLHQLLDLEKEVITLGRDLGVDGPPPLVSPEQLHGIEIDAYAHELAQATVWIGYIQWLHENGFGTPEEPILKPLDTVLHMDAVLAYDEEGNPVEPEWPEADVIIGNPPYLGEKKMRREFGDKYVDDLQEVYAGRLPATSDLVCYWFEKARQQLLRGPTRVGLLATQNIRGVTNQTVLERIKEVGEIFWAESDRDWVLDGATVHLSMIAFDDGSEPQKILDGRQVDAINSDLTSTADLTKAKKLNENKDLAFQGVGKVGDFDIDTRTARRMEAASGNPNGRPNSDVLKRWVTGSDITGRWDGTWIIDFDDMSLEAAAQYELPFEYVLKNVKAYRERPDQRSKRRREYWWQHGSRASTMRAAIMDFDRYIAAPKVSKHRVFIWLTPEYLPSNLVIAIARACYELFNENDADWDMLSVWNEEHIPAMSVTKSGRLPRPI